MLIAGTIGLGVVWGWLIVRLARGRPWQVVARVVLGAAAQLAVVAQLAQALGAAWWVVGVAAGALIAGLWVQALERRAV
jgi:F0F1-type ATP synthase assembly protein I